MKRKSFFVVVLSLVIAVNGLGSTSLAAEAQEQRQPVSAIERASGHFSTTVSAGKYKKLGSAISMEGGEIINFNATYSPRSASVDFGLLDSNNVFYYINSTTGSIDGDVAAPENGSYTPAIRNNYSSSITVSGNIKTGFAAR